MKAKSKIVSSTAVMIRRFNSTSCKKKTKKNPQQINKPKQKKDFKLISKVVELFKRWIHQVRRLFQHQRLVISKPRRDVEVAARVTQRLRIPSGWRTEYIPLRFFYGTSCASYVS